MCYLFTLYKMLIQKIKKRKKKKTQLPTICVSTSTLKHASSIDLISLLVNSPKLMKILLRGFWCKLTAWQHQHCHWKRLSSPFEEGVDIKQVLLPLLKAKCDALKAISINCQGSFLLQVSNEFVLGLAVCPHLKTILMNLDDIQLRLTPPTMEFLLTQCPNLELTDALECIVRGDSTYKTEYKVQLEKERD
jgi:hypothetical protein